MKTFKKIYKEKNYFDTLQVHFKINKKLKYLQAKNYKKNKN